MSSAREPVRFVLVFASLIGLASCNRSQNQAAEYANGNPADGNLAQVGEPGYAPEEQPAATPVYSQGYSEEPIEATEPPPTLPEYNQPPCPGDDYIWTPGYWSYADAGYYWVPGAWVIAPWIGALWTPPWWGFDNGVYILHAGYWGPHIGFYGGIDYGFGYTGRGYYGAYWNGGTVVYNTTVTSVDPRRVRNVYTAQVPRGRADRVSYNGGRGGIAVRPTAQELAVSRDPRTPPVAAQMQHARQASANRAQFAMAGRAQPNTVAADRPLSTNYRAPASRPPAEAMRAARPTPETRPVQPQERAGGAPVERGQTPQNGPGQFRQVPLETRPPVAERTPTPMPRQYEREPIARPPERADATPQPRPQAPARPEFARPEVERRAEQAPNRPTPPAPQFAPPQRRGPAVAAARPQAPPQPRMTAPAPQARHPRPEAQSRPAPPPPRPEAQARPAPPPRPAPQARPQPAHPAPAEEGRKKP